MCFCLRARNDNMKLKINFAKACLCTQGLDGTGSEFVREQEVFNFPKRLPLAYIQPPTQ